MDLSFNCHGFLSNLHLLSLIASITEWLATEVLSGYATFIAELASFYQSYLLSFKTKDSSDTYTLTIGFVAIGIPLALQVARLSSDKGSKKIRRKPHI